MANALRSNLLQTRTLHRGAPFNVVQTTVGSPRRGEAEAFIRDIFARHYNAEVPAFAPNLMMIESEGRIVAATGWRHWPDRSGGRVVPSPGPGRQSRECGTNAADRAGR